jgi:hypothetical protein
MHITWGSKRYLLAILAVFIVWLTWIWFIDSVFAIAGGRPLRIAAWVAPLFFAGWFVSERAVRSSAS